MFHSLSFMNRSSFLYVSDMPCLPRTLFPVVQLIRHVQTLPLPLGSLDFVESSFQERSLLSHLWDEVQEAWWLGLEITLLGIWAREGGLQESCSTTSHCAEDPVHFLTLTKKRGHCRSKYCLFACIGHSRLVLIVVSPSHALPCLPTLLVFPHTPLMFIPLSSSVQVLLSLGEGLLL